MKQTIYGTVPSKSNCYKIVQIKGQTTLAKQAVLRKFEADFYIQCNHYRNVNIEGYFELHMDVFYPSQRADLDNSLKVVLDCLQRVKAIKNDNKCTGLSIRKFLDKGNPRIEFEIKQVLNH
jgi:Holliday junction resolvase RusA-like endonuclease